MSKWCVLLTAFLWSLLFAGIGCVIKTETVRTTDPATGEEVERQRQTEVRGAAPRWPSASR
ncbi:MAG TPA: hypothetical protein PL151_12590 [Phycisphaerae bacterium]|nr:hypothetical protein [Phycisphaerae bacterium]HOJ74467.1 hypothetical protein [Phycisphaerae bacterium]HOM53336.1 hypothetical protein [Phycisphaerae bacterium]HON68417.1 hypothetical protein [Phycisphaerae bacterium]HOQ86189.1 hypothetical protein [Phycisphaerae bacterium]